MAGCSADESGDHNPRGAADESVKIIFDTDMYTDIDDAGALACLHKLADAGECEILATVSSTRGNASVAVIQAINSYYGRAGIPVGSPKGIGVRGACHKAYAGLLERYPHSFTYADADLAPDANTVLRRALAAAPDNSVVICSVGFHTNIRRLLESEGDGISPLDGTSLVKKKVRLWVAMAFEFPAGREYNVYNDAPSSAIALARWPVPVVFSGFEYGKDVFAGRAAVESGVSTPVIDLYSAALPTREEFARDPGRWRRRWFGEGGRAAWDQTAVLAAVRGAESYFNVERGVLTVDAGNGSNVWKASQDGPHMRITEKVPKADVARVIEGLMMQPRSQDLP